MLRRAPTVGRWSVLRRDPIAASPIAATPDFVARQLLRRTGVVFRKTIERERFPVPWWRLVRELRTLEARGEVRGGRFVAGFDSEQYALPDAVTLLRAVRKRGRVAALVPMSIPPSDPLHYRGVLAPALQAQTAQVVSVALFAYPDVMHTTAVVDGKVVRFKLSPALARAHRDNRGKAMSEREAVAFVESKRRARALRRAKPYLETRS